MRKILRLGLVAAYVLAPVLLQAVHLAGEIGRPPSAVCAAERESGCDSVCCAGGCGDTSHHHHDPAHHHDQCAICKAPLGQPAVGVQADLGVILCAIVTVESAPPAARGPDPGAAHASRAPPAIG